MSPDLGDERIGDAVQDNVWVDIARLGRERPGGKTDDRPGLIKRVPGVLLMMADGQSNLLEVRGVRDQEPLQSRQLFGPVRFQSCFDVLTNSTEDLVGAHHSLLLWPC